MIEFINVTKSFKKNKVLKNINLKINKGEFVVLIGPSGCGKTTSLKMINKLILPTSGKILINGENILKKNTIELRRNIGYVIQQTGLFPHMTIRENVELVPSLQKWNKTTAKKRTEELLALIGLDPKKYMDRYPDELSGGQKQRIGFARALAVNPDIILMDEPFSALDPITKNTLQDEIFELQQNLKKTIVFVTHDMDEALKLGDRICIMKDGKIEQFDSPQNILRNPANEFVSNFIGKKRIWNNPKYITSEDLMIDNPLKTSPERTITQGINMMSQNHVDSLLMVDKLNKFQGIVLSDDINLEEVNGYKLKTIMRKDIPCVNTKETIINVLKIMKKNKISYIPVIDNDNTLCGLITKSSLLNVFSKKFIA